MMSLELGKKWVDALRSGVYTQGKHGLRDVVNNEFCCLGVLCELIDPTAWTEYEDDGHGNRSPFMSYGRGNEANGAYAPLDMLPIIDQSRLSNLNDGGKSFEVIADVIEQDILPTLKSEGA